MPSCSFTWDLCTAQAMPCLDSVRLDGAFARRLRPNVMSPTKQKIQLSVITSKIGRGTLLNYNFQRVNYHQQLLC
ncbi:hypothetical protein Q3G72_031595 [Acer saccharum]|nr:hypothetical protein Q3G72_031595 [Acer saccharum]